MMCENRRLQVKSLLEVCRAFEAMGDHIDLAQGLPLNKIFAKNYALLRAVISDVTSVPTASDSSTASSNPK